MQYYVIILITVHCSPSELDVQLATYRNGDTRGDSCDISAGRLNIIMRKLYRGGCGSGRWVEGMQLAQAVYWDTPKDARPFAQ
jgi:hypothetical protein